MLNVDDAFGTPARIDEQGRALVYSDVATEYLAATQGVAVADLTRRGRIEVSGGDRVKLLNNLCTNDLVHLAAESGCEAFFLDARGKLIDYARIFAGKESLWLDVEPGRAEPLIRHLDRYIIREDVKLINRSADFATLFLTGPQSADFLDELGSTEMSSLGLYEHREVTWANISYSIRRSDRSNFPGFDIVVPAGSARDVAQFLLDSGKDRGIRPLGAEVLEILRVEAGFPAMGVDLNSDNLPQEAGRDEQAINFRKGCYIGQETVARLDALGHVNKILRGLIVDAAVVPTAGAVVRAGGKEVGRLTSPVWSVVLAKPIALAVIRVGSETPGKQVEIASAEEAAPAVVSALPIVRPRQIERASG